MHNASIWLAAAALLAATGCKDDNNTASDAGGTDMSRPDTSGGGPDLGSDGGGTDTGTPDMAMLPDGVSIPGLSGAVTASFDANDVLHIACETANDCFAVQGYFHASHRFIQMDVQRRFSTGRLAALIGNAALSIDTSTRALTSTRDGVPLEEALWEAASPEAKANLTAYAMGVNTWIEDFEAGRNGAKTSVEFDLALIDQDAPLLRWSETDSFGSALLLLEDLSNKSEDDIERGLNYPLLTPEQAFDLLGTMSATQVATMQTSGESYSRINALRTFPDATELARPIERLRPRRRLLQDAYEKLVAIDSVFGSPEGLNGSNNWAIGGSMTASGGSVLANDPHLGLSNPALWYLNEIHASGGADELHIAGVSLPGMPGIVLGHNEDISWGATVVFMDLADVYVEELTPDGGSVMFNGSPVEIIEVEHTFEVARGNPVTRTLRFVPHHGPLLSYDPANNEALSLRWAASDARKTLETFVGLWTATTVEEARTAISNSASTNQNWVVADRAGSIGWFPFNAVPDRPWASLTMPPWLPLPGDGSAEWGATIPVEEQPQMLNPANGFIATANNDPTGAYADGDPTNEAFGYITSFGSAGGFREDAIVRRILDGGTAHTADITKEIQGDTFLVLREWIRPTVQAVVDNNPGSLSVDAESFWSTIESWNGECPAGIDGRDPAGPKTADAATANASIGCSAFHFLVYALTEATFADELAPTSIDHDDNLAVRTLVILMNDDARLQGGASYWDNTRTAGTVETRDEIVLEAIEAATTSIRRELGTDSDDWRWGRVHTVLFYANLFNNAGFQQFNEGPFSAPGGLHAINIANARNPSDFDWGFSKGPSMRHVSEVDADGIKSYWTLPGGQRHHRDSDLYLNLLDDWLAAKHFEMPFQPADVAAAAVETVEVVPR